MLDTKFGHQDKSYRRTMVVMVLQTLQNSKWKREKEMGAFVG
jgi:hypothetical protein